MAKDIITCKRCFYAGRETYYGRVECRLKKYEVMATSLPCDDFEDKEAIW